MSVYLVLAFLVIFSNQAFALSASADMQNAYSGEVLKRVLQNYNKPVNVSGYAQALVRIGRDGRPFSCEMIKQSEFYRADENICLAVAMAQQFPLPPNNAQSAEVYLTFVYDDQFPLVYEEVMPAPFAEDELMQNNTSQQFFTGEEEYLEQDSEFTGESFNNQAYSSEVYAAPTTVVNDNQANEASLGFDDLFTPDKQISGYSDVESTAILEENTASFLSPPSDNMQSPSPQKELNFAEQVMLNAQKLLALPMELPKGNYRNQVKLKVDSNGKLINYSTVSPSQNQIYDDHIKEVLLTDGVIPIPINGAQEVILTFDAQK